jgi:chromosome segregation ATPase
MSEDLTKKLNLDDSDKLTLILTTVQNLDRRSVATETQFGTVEARLERLGLGFDNLDSRLQHLEQRVEQRFYDTRPIWHKLVDDIAQLQKGQERLEEGQGVLNDAIRKINADVHAIDERLHRLELNRKRPNSST